MNVAGFIANRIAFNQQRSFSRFIIRLSVVATMISVAVMIITLAFANGFQKKVAEKVYSFLGNARIQSVYSARQATAEEWPVVVNDTVLQEVAANPHVAAVHAFATRFAILKTADNLEGILLKGFDSSNTFAHLQPFLKEGHWPSLKDSSYSREIAVSQKIASQMQLKLNDRILIYFIKPDGSYRPDKLTITGFFKTGIDEYDRSIAIGDIKLLRRLNDWQPNEVGGYEIFFKNNTNIDGMTQVLSSGVDLPKDLQVSSIHSLAPQIFNWLNMQDVTRNVLIAVMIVVAAINLITCIIILVLERIKMIGVLKAIGAAPFTIQQIFLRHSLIITGWGILVGAGVALGFIYLQNATGFIKLNEDSYYIDTAAVSISAGEVLLICGITFIICLLVLLLPTLIVKKIQPVKAIQFK